jgi:hypothetical protein
MAIATYELYALTFASGRCYIGVSKNGAAERYKKHQTSANNRSNVICHKAWRKYGPPDMRVLAVADKSYIWLLRCVVGNSRQKQLRNVLRHAKT